MKILTSLREIADMAPCALALGNFDGLHKGHQKVIDAAFGYADAHGLEKAVLCFSNIPRNFLHGDESVPSLLQESEKLRLLRERGTDCLLFLPFDASISEMPADRFLEDLLLRDCSARALSCGFNFRYGKRGAGTAELLQEEAARLGFAALVQPAYREDGAVISSTLIRGLIAEGRVDAAARYLDRPFCVCGTVKEGRHLGRGMRYPTCNIDLPEGLVRPAHGVYASRVVVDGRSLPAVSNAGVRPTVGDGALRLESHIFDFHETLYGREIRVELLSMLRPERRFASMEELAAQIAKDCLTAEAYHANI
jgi:riboflavin kinase/FMN adenylyltransferase